MQYYTLVKSKLLGKSREKEKRKDERNEDKCEKKKNLK